MRKSPFLTAVASALCAFAFVMPPACQAAGLTIDVRGADIVDVIRLLATESGVNLVPDGSIRHDKVTLRLHDVTFDEAIGALVRAFDLQVHRDGTILLIGTAASMNRRFAEGGELGTKTAVFTLRNARPDDVVKPLTEGLAPGTVVVGDKRTWSVIVTGSEATIVRARTLLDALDAPAASVAGSPAKPISLRHVKASEALKLLHGFVPDGSAVADDGQNTILVSSAGETAAAAAAMLAEIDKPAKQVMFEVKVIDVTPVDETTNVGLEFGGVDFSGQSIVNAATYAFTRSSLQINAQLNFLVSKGNAKILATPRLVTLNNHEASLLIGQTYPIIYYDIRSGNQQLQQIDIGVRLRMTPTIGSDGSIVAELHPEYSEIANFVQNYPVIANRKLDSTLRVSDGQTIVLGGLMRDVSSETLSKMPILGDLPVLGPIFRNRQKSHTRDEVVFLITPHIVDQDVQSSPPGAAPP